MLIAVYFLVHLITFFIWFMLSINDLTLQQNALFEYIKRSDPLAYLEAD